MKVNVQSKYDQIVLRQTIYLKKIINKFEFLNEKTAFIFMQFELKDTLIKSIKQIDSKIIK